MRSIVQMPLWRLLMPLLLILPTTAVAQHRPGEIVVEHGTVPLDALYFDLKPHSRNGGEVDYEALIRGAPQTVVRNPDSRFVLYRIGDAVASRNIHAAVYDALRLAKDF